jgi:hypothetical protein
MAYAHGHLHAVCIDKGTRFTLHALTSPPAVVELGCDEGAAVFAEGSWKGSMRKDCHGMFARRAKGKRAVCDGDADLSDIDDE